MNLLDARTVIFSYAISNLICMLVIANLWQQNRKRLAGLDFWLADFVMQFFALVLIALRGIVPDFLSMTVSNTMVIGGTILLFIGLEYFTDKRGPQLHNYILLAVFLVVHAYFVFILPNLAARNIIISLGLLVICSHAAWLMLRRVEPEMRPITRGVGQVFVGFCLVSIARIIVDLIVPVENDFFHTNAYDTLLLITYQMLFVVLTFSLFLMVNHRLFADLESDITVRKQVEEALRLSEEKFLKAFHASPDAIIISRLSDGQLIEVNDGFCRLTGYAREETLSSSSIGLGLWAKPQDRDRFVADLRANHSIRDNEYDFRIKSGKILNCILAAEIINLGSEAHVLSVVRDITERKQAEEIFQIRLRLLEFAAIHSLEELMQQALDEIGHITNSPIGFYHFVEADQKTLSLQAWSTRTLEEFCRAEGKGMHYDIDQAGVWADCVRQRKPVIHNNYAALPHRKGMPDGHAEVIRELVVPILREERVVSILGVGNKPTDYDNKDVELVAYIADVVWEIVQRKRAEEKLKQLSRAVEQSPASIVITDTTGNIEYVNPKFTQVTGYTMEEAIGKNPRILKTDQTPEEVHRQLWKTVTDGKEWHGEFANRKKNGELFHEAASISPITDSSGVTTHYLAVKEDITERKQNEAKLQYLNDRLSTLHNITIDLLNRHKVEDVLDAILLRASDLLESPFGLLTILDGDTHVVRATTEMTASLIGVRAASQDAYLSSQAIKTRQTQVIQDYFQWSKRLRIHDPYQLKAVADVPILINEIAVGVIALGRTEPGKPYINEDVQAMDSLAQLAALAIDTAQLFATAQNELAEKIRVEEDLRRANQTLQLQLEAIEQLQAELREQAIRDPLTGLYNRRYLNETLARELARAVRENYPISFVMIDIDHFKKINDTFGHGTGDVVLQKLSTQLLGQTRIVDITCRYGGEEFLIILPNVTTAIAFQIAERWRKSFMGMTMPLGYSSVQTTLSCGISEFPLNGNTVEKLISTADRAMYRAKAAGRNRVVIWQNEMDNQSLSGQ